jgi:hypothetical protein
MPFFSRERYQTVCELSKLENYLIFTVAISKIGVNEMLMTIIEFIKLIKTIVDRLA